MDKKTIGNNGEEAAARYLLRNGYAVLERNFSTRVGEIDIIAKDSRDGCLVFVEVKTRKSRDYGDAFEFVDSRKQQRLKRAAELYCAWDMYMRFDVIEVYYTMRDNIMYVLEINHIEDAF